MSLILSRFASPEARASLYQFTVYLPGAVSSVFLGIWLSEHGLPADQIGIINSIPMLCLLAVNMLIGRLADRAKDWRSVIVMLSVVAAAAAFGLFFVNEFWGVMLVWSLVTMFTGSIPPIIDAASVRMTRRNGTDFGVVRAWATVGYVVGAGGIGVLLAVFGANAFAPLFVATSLLRAGLSLLLPRFRAPEQAETLATMVPTKLRDSLKPWFVLPLIAFAMINASHALIGGFGGLLWIQNGVPNYFVGPLLAIAAAAEAVIMFAWRRFGGRITARNMILAACIASLLRFTVMAFNPPVELLFVVQMLHAVSFGVGYFGVVHFIANWTDESNAAEAQGFANMLNQGMAVLALAGFGWLVVRLGSYAFFASSVVAVLATACVLISLRIRPPKDAQ
ncbi:MFS transporter [Devosia sp. J2-20]|jgi:PPP family 3-phenylpropionic acid transporter|uniref:MFS transporter n=1 Tax=Devosia litorisediminis TaxID=2829817 RepID=A0A942E4M0_9HYPH|nr:MULTISPECIES: MFS transporter [Devosia]MBS3847865.1 MFS transporter [Devosia litorisediminis]MCZ4345845.1 MFS transporter [Devosia neptuniae]WDQ99023.1 MFS transporter [Devosia sp. J2-20]|tara:strand:- start:23470 stop:24648 length:1179 start_codon:yes stop_codon:yes gene_type:complete